MQTVPFRHYLVDPIPRWLRKRGVSPGSWRPDCPISMVMSSLPTSRSENVSWPYFAIDKLWTRWRRHFSSPKKSVHMTHTLLQATRRVLGLVLHPLNPGIKWQTGINVPVSQVKTSPRRFVGSPQTDKERKRSQRLQKIWDSKKGDDVSESRTDNLHLFSLSLAKTQELGTYMRILWEDHFIRAYNTTQ